MNRFVSQVVLSTINNKKLLQILHLKKLKPNETDFLLPLIITFKKFFLFYIEKNFEYYPLEYLIWIDRFYHFDYIFFKGHLDISKWIHENTDGYFKNGKFYTIFPRQTDSDY